MSFVPDSIVLHTLAFEGDASAADIDRWHRERGFSQIGYHLYIRRSGQIEKGRDFNTIGAHCKAAGMNRRSIGIAFEGHGDFEPWTSEQADTFYRKTYRELRMQFGIMPERVFGHCEFDSGKTCPGKLIDMSEVRERLITRYSSKKSHASEK